MSRICTYGLLALTILLSPVSRATAQIYDADGLYVDTIFHDHINRQADDFVRVSLVEIDPGEVLYSVLGHSCLRLQCPAFDMDFIFSYEGEGVEHKMLRFLMGDLKMGLFGVPTEEYLEQYREQGRGVREYEMSLPIAYKQNLWRVLDRHVDEGLTLQYDYFHRGCAHSLVDVLHEALPREAIHYAPWPEKYRQMTQREIVQAAVDSAQARGLVSERRARWNALYMYALIGVEGDRDYPCERKLIVPADLVEVWQQATVYGEPLLSQQAHVLVPSEAKSFSRCLMTPRVLAWTLLIWALLSLMLGAIAPQWTSWHVVQYVLLGITTVMGGVMTYLLVFSSLPCTTWNWLIVPYNILPAIAWHWRRYWSLPYAVVVLLWVAVMICWPHQLVDSAYLCVAIAFAVALISDKINMR